MAAPITPMPIQPMRVLPGEMDSGYGVSIVVPSKTSLAIGRCLCMREELRTRKKKQDFPINLFFLPVKLLDFLPF